MVRDHSDIERKNRCRHIGYSFRLTARVLLYAPSHREDSTYHGLCYTSPGALAAERGTVVDLHLPNGEKTTTNKQNKTNKQTKNRRKTLLLIIINYKQNIL